MQVHIFNGGGFVAHKVYIPESDCKFSIWVDISGNLTDAERFDKLMRGYSVKRASAAWIKLEQVAQRIAARAR